MTDREEHLQAFLAQEGWDDRNQAVLAGDASNRRYLRLTRSNQKVERAILMDAPPYRGENIMRFVRIAEYLSSISLSAPKILAQDEDQGFLLLEDLGDDLFARVIPQSPKLESLLYETATDVLIELHCNAVPKDVDFYGPDYATDLSALIFDFYLGALSTADHTDLRKEFRTQMSRALQQTGGELEVLIQRDYHAENLLWLPEREGLKRVGLLDFQDAMIGHRAYDLVSLLQDARRDVPPEIEKRMITRYVEKTGLDRDSFSLGYAVWGAQRNFRIIGVFARLCIRDGKPHYIDLIPRVWRHLQRDLKHPVLKPLLSLVAEKIPAPTKENLEKLKSKCRTSRTP